MASSRCNLCLAALMLLILAGCEGGGGGVAGGSRTVKPEPVARYKPAPIVTPKPDPPPKPVQPTSVAVKNADDVFLAGKIDQARDLYRKRVLLNGNDLDAHDGFIRCSMKLGKLKDALRWYEDRLNTHVSASPAWGYGASRAMLMSGDFEQSSELAYSSLRRDRSMGRLYYLLGLKYRTQAAPEYKTASNAFKKAIRFDRNYGASYYQLAYLEAYWQGDLAEAKRLSAKALSLLRPVEQEERFLSHELYGRLLVGEKDYKGALAQFEKARELGGSRIYKRNNIGRLYELMGEREKAIAEWRSVQKRFGLAHPTGLSAYVSARRLQSKLALDFTNFLPGGTERNYASLVSYLLKPKSARAVPAPANLARWLDELKTTVLLRETDLDGDGKLETVIVQVRQKWDADVKRYYLGDAALYVFTQQGGMPGFYKSAFDHFRDVHTIDLNADGKKELVFSAFSSPNILNVLVFTRARTGRYINVFTQTVKCSIGACGVLVDDLDGDGTVELVSISGDDLWTTVYRWDKDGTFSDASVDFPVFYRDYVKQYEKYTPQQLQRWPMVAPHLERARVLSRGRPSRTDIGTHDE